ncbi:unnamed protein product, partial [Vitis vinifera]
MLGSINLKLSAKGFHELEGQNSNSYQFHGVLPAELDQKLCHVLIEQQENQIVDLESELHLAQSKLHEKEAELQALKDCVKRLTEFSLSTVSGNRQKKYGNKDEVISISSLSSSISRTKARHLGTRGREFQSDERQSREAEREGVRLVKMKLSSKTMSSPGRTEKFPPPLMRFLRSNVGSRSRGRSRSSPMFVRKKNTAIETQEPSSPKVTCIGQVRVRRSKQGRNEEEEARVFYSSSFSPPKNALLLTRCRSAPYRSSSLASRFWGSPLATEEEQKTEPENTDQQNPASENEPSSRDSAAESRTDPETDRDSEYLNQSEDSTSERSTKPTKTEAFKTGEEATAHPLILTRCKSEPARTGARLNPDTTLFWKKRRLGFAEPRSPSVCD